MPLPLLDALYANTAPAWLREIPAVQTLRRVWVQNFCWEEGELHWRDLSNAPAAGALINSPYDPEALLAQKRELQWIGYKVHLTETCDDDLPHLITHVETTPAPQADDEALPHIHAALATHDLLPQKHVVDCQTAIRHEVGEMQEFLDDPEKREKHGDFFFERVLDYQQTAIDVWKIELGWAQRLQASLQEASQRADEQKEP